jgi:23S rRNA (cytidine1920-2'-O)/16S rRNA (cytidine1409-2'-O)-methyltransferase
LKKIIPQVLKLQSDQVMLVALIKPQFEVAKKEATKGKGVIKDSKIRDEVILSIKEFAESCGFISQGVVESPIRGAKGNIETLIYLVKTD